MKNQKSLNEIITDAVSYLMKNHAPKPFSQGGLAKVSGVSQGTICMNLKGERGWSIDVLERLCPPLGVPLEDLIAIGRELHIRTNPLCDNAAFQIGDTVVRKRELLSGCVNRTDVKKYQVYAIFTTAAGTQYQLNDPAEEYREDWYFENESDLVSLHSAEKMKAKINAALNEVN